MHVTRVASQTAFKWDGRRFLEARKFFVLNGGAERDRTDDLLSAIQALSQLSYSPTITLLTFCSGARFHRGKRGL